MVKILIIEDDPYVLRMYKRLFAHQDYKVDMAKTGEEGLKLAQSVSPSLILLDIMLPGMNGLEVLEKLKQGPKTSQIPVLMLTNLGEEHMIDQAKKLGASSYMLKADFTPSQLAEEVEKHLDPVQQ